MDFLIDNLPTLGLVVASLYPPLLFLLPASTANKISLGVKIVKTIADTLEKAQDSKGGLSFKKDETKSTFIQKPKN